MENKFLSQFPKIIEDNFFSFLRKKSIDNRLSIVNFIIDNHLDIKFFGVIHDLKIESYKIDNKDNIISRATFTYVSTNEEYTWYEMLVRHNKTDLEIEKNQNSFFTIVKVYKDLARINSLNYSYEDEIEIKKEIIYRDWYYLSSVLILNLNVMNSSINYNKIVYSTRIENAEIHNDNKIIKINKESLYINEIEKLRKNLYAEITKKKINMKDKTVNCEFCVESQTKGYNGKDTELFSVFDNGFNYRFYQEDLDLIIAVESKMIFLRIKDEISNFYIQYSEKEKSLSFEYNLMTFNFSLTKDLMLDGNLEITQVTKEHEIKTISLEECFFYKGGKDMVSLLTDINPDFLDLVEKNIIVFNDSILKNIDYKKELSFDQNNGFKYINDFKIDMKKKASLLCSDYSNKIPKQIIRKEYKHGK